MTGVEQMKLLGGGGAVVALGFQTGVAWRTAEQFQEGAADAAIGQGNRALSLRYIGEWLGNGARIFLRRAGDLAEAHQ